MKCHEAAKHETMCNFFYMNLDLRNGPPANLVHSYLDCTSTHLLLMLAFTVVSNLRLFQRSLAVSCV